MSLVSVELQYCGFMSVTVNSSIYENFISIYIFISVNKKYNFKFVWFFPPPIIYFYQLHH